MGKLESTKSAKKPVSTNVPQGVVNESCCKGFSKASSKVQAHGSRKALGDVSNTMKAPVQTRGSQKALAEVSNTVKAPVHLKLRVEAPPTCFEEEGFLHDHQQCISSMRKADLIDQMDLFMMIHESDSSKKFSSSSPCAASQTSRVGPESPMRYFDMKEMPELSIKFDFFPNCKFPVSPSYFSPNCKSPVSPSYFSPNCKFPVSPNNTKMPFSDFQVMQTPKFPRH